MPIYIARNAAAKGVEVFVAGIKGNALAQDYPAARVRISNPALRAVGRVYPVF